MWLNVSYHCRYIIIAFFSLLRSLFPGLEGRLILDNLKPHLLAALKEAAQTRGII